MKPFIKETTISLRQAVRNSHSNATMSIGHFCIELIRIGLAVGAYFWRALPRQA